MALGMAVITSTGTVGLVLGPAFAGVTVFPEYLKSPFLKHFPTFIPNAIFASGLLLAIIFFAIFIPGSSNTASKYTALLTDEDRTETCVNDDDLTENEDDRSADIVTECHGDLSIKSLPSWRIVIMSTKLFKVFKTKDCILSCILYGLLGFSAIAFHELFPLLASTSVQFHGMAMTTSEIGIVLLVVSIVLIVVQIPLLTFIINKLGAKKSFCFSALFQGLLVPLLPLIAGITSRVTLWAVLCTHVLVYRLLVQLSFLSVTVLINNTSGAYLNATSNGLGFTFTAIGRFLSPLVFGPLYSWSLDIKRGRLFINFPFNQYFSFLVWGVVSIGICCLGMMLSKRADKKC